MSSSLHGYDEVGRSMRRTIMRYACLSLTLVFRVLSPRVKSRFPKLKDLVRTGLLLDDEMIMLEDLEYKFPGEKTAPHAVKLYNHVNLSCRI